MFGKNAPQKFHSRFCNSTLVHLLDFGVPQVFYEALGEGAPPELKFISLHPGVFQPVDWW